MTNRLSTRAKLKLKATTPIVKGLFNALPHISDKAVISLIKTLFGENRYPEGQIFIEKVFSSLKQIFKTANATCRKAIINNMIINEGVRGQKIRNQVTKELGFDIPVLLVITPTQRCPLKCYGCYAAEHENHEDLTYEAFDKVITEAKALGIYFFVISGGEPFIYDRIFDIFEKHNDAYFQVYTSAFTLAERDHVAKLAELGNVLPCISVEGFEKETEERRGKGHFQRIKNAMAKLRDAGVPFGFSATATRVNNDMLLSDELVDYYAAEGACLGYYFQYMPIGRSPVFELVPTPEQRMYRYKRIAELRRSKSIILADFWCDGTLVGGCLAGGRRYMHVNNLGHAEPCVFAQAYDMTVYEHSLTEILRDSKLFKSIRKRQPYSDNLLRPCMVIDVPECWRDAVEESNATYTSRTADNVGKELKENIERFAKEYADLADVVWERDYKETYAGEVKYVHEMRKRFETNNQTK